MIYSYCPILLPAAMDWPCLQWHGASADKRRMLGGRCVEVGRMEWQQGYGGGQIEFGGSSIHQIQPPFPRPDLTSWVHMDMCHQFCWLTSK